MKYTKAQLKKAMYLLLDVALPHIQCELIEQRGNYLCDRCDDCMFEQLIKKAKDENVKPKHPMFEKAGAE